MPVRRILQLGEPLLREVSRPVVFPANVGPILDDLRDTLHEFRRTHGYGRGISAVQIGELQRIVYIEFEGVPYSLLNPAFDRLSPDKFRLWDDCFSFPDLEVYLERSVSVTLSYQDPSGAPHTLDATDKLSELLQHELDHLDGILAIDRALERRERAAGL